MALNAVVKGKTGEQEIARELNVIINSLLLEYKFSLPEKPIVQRNQNQSAVGGKDLLVGGLPLAIEVKRQEQLSVDSWWNQCAAQGARNKEFPILIYRQNNKKWNVVIYSSLCMSNSKSITVRATIQFSDFLTWFREYVREAIINGWVPKV